MKHIPHGFLDRLLLTVFLLTVPYAVLAQGTWSGECTASKPCTLVASVSQPEPTVCVVKGLPTGIPEVNVIDKTSMPANIQEIVTESRGCIWSNIVLSQGTYSLTALVKDASGRSSPETLPLVATVLPPLLAPSNLRLGSW